MTRIAIAGGGTGGHVYPALAVAEALRDAGAEAVFIGTERGLEARIVPAAGHRLETVPAAPLPRGLRGLARLPAALARNLAGVAEARRILRDVRPAAVLGVGGYASVPAVIAARLLGIPVILHEQNVLPGRANRLLAGAPILPMVRADRVALSWESSRRWIDGPHVVVTGNPVRRDVRDADRAEARRRRGLDGRLFIVILGGSRGARRLNESVPDLARLLADRDVAILWSMGRDHYRPVDLPNVEAVPYIEAMAEALAAADVVVGRAGATSLAEIAVRGVASVLVPYPHAADAHQRRNAEAFAAAGAARIVDDADCDGPTLHRALAPYLDDEAARRGAGAAAWSLARPRAAEDLADLVLGTKKGTAPHTRSDVSPGSAPHAHHIGMTCREARGWPLAPVQA